MKKVLLTVLVGGWAALLPQTGRGCACGCGLLDVGTSSMLPNGRGGTAFVEFNFQDQDRNWANSGPAPAVNNDDKEIRSEFTTYGLQYMFNRSWGVQVELPYGFRDFKTLGGPTGDQVVALKWNSFGDLRLQGLYTGFSHDMSSGVTFGLKLPTGDFKHNDAYGDVDRDTEIGTGSTDALLGAFHRHRLMEALTWFAQAQLDVPIFTQDQYQPGTELDAALGLYFQGWDIHGVNITPLAQVIGTVRTRDFGANASGGANSDPGGSQGSGYQRVMLSPGIEITYGRFTFYTDVEVPVVQDFVGNQLAAPWLLKSYINITF